MGARWLLTETDWPPIVTFEADETEGYGALECWPRNSCRSVFEKRRSRRRPTRCAESSPALLHRRIEAALTRRYRAASSVLSRPSLIMTWDMPMHSIVYHCVVTTAWGMEVHSKRFRSSHETRDGVKGD